MVGVLKWPVNSRRPHIAAVIRLNSFRCVISISKTACPTTPVVLADLNPYRPSSVEPANSWSARWHLALRGTCFLGLFVSFWYIGWAVLYFAVFGDNPPDLMGFYPVVPAAILAGSIVFWRRNHTASLVALAVLTAPAWLNFFYRVLRYGLW